MKRNYLINKSELEKKISITIGLFDLYSFVKKGLREEENWIFINTKGVILKYQLSEAENNSILSITAISPFCVITKSYEQQWIKRFMDDLDMVLSANSPLVPLNASSNGNPSDSFNLKDFLFIKFYFLAGHL